MSTWTDAIAAYKALPPDKLTFWQNIYQVYIRFLSPEVDIAFLDPRPRSPAILFFYSWKWNDYYGLPQSEPFWVEGVPPEELGPWSPSANSFFEFSALPDQFGAVSSFDTWDSRPKYKVRKSYWTGVARRRRNI